MDVTHVVTAGRSKLGRDLVVTAGRPHNFAVQYSVQTPLKTINFAEEQNTKKNISLVMRAPTLCTAY